jgi:ABC-type glycerol-3-phosphate transport system substrate-binding protein
MGRLYTARDMLRCAILGRAILACILACAAAPALAQWEIRVWHAMGGAQAAELERLAARFNAGQQDYRVVLAHKGAYEETLAAVLDGGARGRRSRRRTSPRSTRAERPRCCRAAA